MTTHVSELSYTNSDDGVWLRCKPCKWRHNLGYFATVEHAQAVWQKHTAEETEGSEDGQEA
jgi:hypothetical protein